MSISLKVVNIWSKVLNVAEWVGAPFMMTEIVRSDFTMAMLLRTLKGHCGAVFLATFFSVFRCDGHSTIFRLKLNFFHLHVQVLTYIVLPSSPFFVHCC